MIASRFRLQVAPSVGHMIRPTNSILVLIIETITVICKYRRAQRLLHQKFSYYSNVTHCLIKKLRLPVVLTVEMLPCSSEFLQHTLIKSPIEISMSALAQAKMPSLQTQPQFSRILSIQAYRDESTGQCYLKIWSQWKLMRIRRPRVSKISNHPTYVRRSGPQDWTK